MTCTSNGEWFVYVLRCADSSFYTGITNDVSRRCEQHNAGTASRYTRGRRPTSLVYLETVANRSMALKRELAIKALSRHEKMSLIRSGALDNAAVHPSHADGKARGGEFDSV